MQLKVSGIEGDRLSLGVQSNTAFVIENAHWKARAWAPKRAKSYTISSFKFTDYHGESLVRESPYARIKVVYFSTLGEGEHRLDCVAPKPPHSPKGFSISGPCELIYCRFALTKGYCLPDA